MEGRRSWHLTLSSWRLWLRLEFSEGWMLLRSWEATDIKVIVSTKKHLVPSKHTVAIGGIDISFLCKNDC